MVSFLVDLSTEVNTYFPVNIGIDRFSVKSGFYVSFKNSHIYEILKFSIYFAKTKLSFLCLK